MSGGTDRGFVFKNSGSNVAAITSGGRFLGSAVYLDGSSSQNQYVAADSTHSLTVRNMGATAHGGLVLQGSDGTHGLQLYFDGSGANYGFLDGAWASWDIKKIRNGAFSVDEGSGLKRVLNEANWSSYISIPTAVTNNNQLTNGAGYQTGTGTVAQSHYVSGNAFATNGPDSVLEYAQSSSVSDTKLAPSTDWHNSIRMGHGDPYSYYSSAIAIRMTGSGPGDLYTQTIQSGTGGGWSKHWSARNDGSGSGLDADLLDGNHASAFLTAEVDTLATVTGRGASTSTEIDFNNDIHVRNVVSDNNYGEGMFGVYASTRHQHVWSMGEAYKLNAAGTSVGNLYGLSYTHTNVGTGYGANSAAGLGHQLNGRANGTLQWALGDGIYSTVTGNVWGASNDGSGSGLDADLLDGQQGSYYFQSSVSDQEEAYHLDIRDSRAAMVTPDGEDDRRVSAHFTNQIPGYSDWRSAITLKGWSDGYYAWQIHGPSSTGNPNSGLYYRDGKGSTWNSSYEIWHAGRDGSGSGLDADLLDGIDSARVVYASGTNAMGVSRVGFASLTNSRAGFYDVYNSGTPTTTWYSLVNMPHSSANHGHQIAGSFYSAGDIYNRNNNNTSLSAWAKIWNTVNDGAGSGLVADYATKVTFNTQGNSNTTLKLLLGDPSNSTIACRYCL